MKAIEVTRHGGPEVLELVEKLRPVPGEGQILIEVKAAGINFLDLSSRDGTYPAAPPLPFIPGIEASGIVAEVGPGVASVNVGQRVAAFVTGGYAEFALAPANGAVPLPDAIDYATATALLVQGLTAYFLPKLAGEFKPGKSVVVTAASGGVGSLLVQIAKLWDGGTVIGLASTEEKRDFVMSLGADYAVDYTQPGWAEKVRGLTGGKGVDLFVDATGDLNGEGPTTLGTGGFWIIYGSQKGGGDGISGKQLSGLLFGGKTIRGFSLYNVIPDTAAIGGALQELFTWTIDGKLHVETGDRYPLSQAAKAHEDIAARRTSGKVVLEP